MPASLPNRTGRSANSSTQNAGPAYPNYTIGGTHIRHPPPSADGRRHCTLVGLPYDYAQCPDRHYPVLYLCDGYWDFLLLLGLYGGLLWDRSIQEFLIVGLAYDSGYPDAPGISERQRDYRPSVDETLIGQPFSQSALYLEYLAETVLPFIEQEYRVAGKPRTIAGCSACGTFALFAMLRKPDLFQSIISISPDLITARGLIPRLEHQFYAMPDTVIRSPRRLPRLFMAVGDHDQPNLIAAAAAFDRQLDAHRYGSFQKQFWICPGESHASMKGVGYSRGMRFAFAP